MSYADAFVRRARIEHGTDDSIGFAPNWQMQRITGMGDQRVAVIALEGGVDEAATRDLDPDRLGRDQSPVRAEYIKLVVDRKINWTIVPTPTPAWAATVYPDLPPDEGVARLWEAVAHMCRLDADDPVAAWKTRMNRLIGVSERLTEHHFSSIGLRGPGTDLVVGLLPSSRWMAANFHTEEGLEHHPNLPTEEVFTTPDSARVDGVVTSTKPLEIDGTIVRGLTVRFEAGTAVSIDADEGAEMLRARSGLDAGGSRLGEIALVDGEGRIGPLDTVFYTTLIDENAASHLAFGNAYTFALEDSADHPAANRSAIHIDFMVGSPQVDVDGIDSSGKRVPLLRTGVWQI